MPENEQDQDNHSMSFSLPPDCGHFVGRNVEMEKLMAFLGNSASRKPIMLVHGPRGVGKSTLVREAIGCAKEQNLPFKGYVWLDRSWASELRALNDKRSTNSNARTTLDLGSLKESDSYDYLQMLAIKKTQGDNHHSEALLFLDRTLKNHPFLLVIDDFDEYDGLGDDRGVCEYLENITSPNKVILTSRLIDHKFIRRSFTPLEVGLLNEEEIKTLVKQCGFEDLDSNQLVDRDLDATASHVWTVSGGLPEFIIRFFLPIAEQKGWLLDAESDWEAAFEHFSAGYLGQRSQAELPWEYEEKHSDSLAKCAEKLKRLPNEARNVLITLALQEDVQDLDERELAQALGYLADGNRKELSRCRRALIFLERERLIARRLETSAQSRNKGVQSEVIWTLLPFTKAFIKNQLLNVNVTEADFYCAQADRWISFVESPDQSSEHIERQVDRIYPIFLWCITYQEWERALRLGEMLRASLWKSYSGTEKERAKLIDICQKNADIAQQPGMSNQKVAIIQWSLLAQIYSNTSKLSELDLALEYADKAIQCFEQAEQSDELIDEEWMWAELVAMIVVLLLSKQDVNQVQYWLEQMEARGQEKHESWQIGAAELGRLHPDVVQAEKWLTKAAHIADAQGNLSIAIQSYTDLAILCLQNGNFEKSLECVQQTKTIINKSTPDKEITQNRIRAIAVEARIAQYSDNRQDSKNLYVEARQLAKNIKLDSVADELQRQLDILAFQEGEFDPISRVDKLLGVRVLWGKPEAIESNVVDLVKRIDGILGVNFQWEKLKGRQCPICRQGFVIEDLMENRLQLCQNCGNYFHIDCLTMTVGNESCPLCRSPISEIN